MGRVRTNVVKRSARQIVEAHFATLSCDFDSNKKRCEEVATIATKRLRNKIAGFATHLVSRLQRGTVRGISLALQEEERERRLDFVPDVSEIDVERIVVDKDTKEMLDSLNLGNLPRIHVQGGAPKGKGKGKGFGKGK